MPTKITIAVQYMNRSLENIIEFVGWISFLQLNEKWNIFFGCLFYRCIHHYNEIGIALGKSE